MPSLAPFSLKRKKMIWFDVAVIFKALNATRRRTAPITYWTVPRCTFQTVGWLMWSLWWLSLIEKPNRLLTESPFSYSKIKLPVSTRAGSWKRLVYVPSYAFYFLLISYINSNYDLRWSGYPNDMHQQFIFMEFCTIQVWLIYAVSTYNCVFIFIVKSLGMLFIILLLKIITYF